MKQTTKDILDKVTHDADLLDGPSSGAVRLEWAALASLGIGDVDRAQVYATLAVAHELAKRS